MLSRQPIIFILLLSTAVVVSGFAAAKKNNNKRKNAARTSKGFGAPPPTLDEILSKFRTRLPDNAKEQDCPCQSGKKYGNCCHPLHVNPKACLTMTDVLRSRYSAFTYRNIKYIMDTTHETCRDYREDKIAWAKDLNKGGMFDSFDFVNLDAGPEESSTTGDNADNDDDEGYIEFKVTLRARENTLAIGGSAAALEGQETVISERSRFLRNPSDGSWSYASGDVQSDVVGLENVTLNA